ncbi:MAG: hypothetical protein A2V86_01370 [Deltaproteobacteria bacterium RBG_16_49_23]|nr:MAG: hypothetical protein A2V86_01370 [Deltaproteobacteria bacterium RBG_16_49_23]
MRKMILFVAVSAVCLVFVSGAIAQPNKFWAMDVGNFWDYNGSNPIGCIPGPCTWTSRTNVAAIDPVTVPGLTTYRLDGFSGGITLQDMDWYSVNPLSPFDFRWHRGEYLQDQMTVTFNGGLFVGGKQIAFGVPLIENTTGTFNDPTFTGPIDITSTVTVVGFGRVTVPLGTFQAYEVHRQISVPQLGGQVMDRTRWFAPYIGIVQDVEVFGPEDIDTKVLADLNVAAVFNDVPIKSGPGVNPFYQYVMGIYDDGITGGCGAGTYCPGNNVTREQMAAFIVRAKEGEPPANYCDAGISFTDVQPASPFCKYIKRLVELGITAGCEAGKYCPTDNVLRQQMAAFIVRAVEGEPLPNYCDTGISFTDVQPASVFCKYIKRLVELGVTQGCQPGMYCPGDNVLRNQMAAFLARAFLGMQ